MNNELIDEQLRSEMIEVFKKYKSFGSIADLRQCLSKTYHTSEISRMFFKLCSEGILELNCTRLILRENMEDQSKRRSGRTTGLMLEAIGKAVKSPGTLVEFTDHYTQGSRLNSSCHIQKLKELIKSLNLNVTVTRSASGDKIFLFSNHCGYDNDLASAEKSWEHFYGEKPNLCSRDWSFFKLGYERAKK